MTRNLSITIFLVLATSLAVAQAQLPNINTVAGGGPNNMQATSANLPAPVAVAYDKAGNLYVASGLQAFKVDTSGMLTIVAGNGVQDPDFGDGGPATEAEFGQLAGVASDPGANVFILDNNAQADVRRVDGSTGVITHFALISDTPLAMQSDAAGNLYVSGNIVVYKVDTSGNVTKAAGGSPICAGKIDALGDGCPALQSFIDKPHGVAFDSAGNMFIADFGNCLVRRVDAATGIITRFAGTTCFAPPGDGGPATGAGMGPVGGIAIDSSNNMFICDQGNFNVRKVTAGIISTYAGDGKQPFAGDGGLATKAQLSCSGMTTDSKGNLSIADSFNNRVRLVTASNQIISTYAGTGDVFYSGDGGPAIDASMQSPVGVSTDANGEILISEGGIDNRIRRIDLNGKITTVAGVGEVDGVASTAPLGIGGPATSANFSPQSVVSDGAGNIYIADGNVYRVDAITSIFSIYAGVGPGGAVGCAAQTDRNGDGCLATNALVDAFGLAFDASGNLFLVDVLSYVRRIDAKTQIITAVAGNGTNTYSGDGGPATSAGLNNPRQLALDSAGDIFVTDNSSRVRRIDAKTGIINTFAGTGIAGFSGDGGPATSAQIQQFPASLAVDGGGNLFIADNLRIRRVDAVTGIINTSAGIGTFDLSGDGGPAINAALAAPLINNSALAFDTCGNLLTQSATRIRRIGNNPEIAMSSPSVGSLNFTGQLVTTSSSPQAFTDKDTGCIGLQLTSIALADTTNFSLTENCSVKIVSPSNTCTVNVTFKPTAARLFNTTINVVTSDPNSPNVINLSGKGTDFSLAAASGGSTTATVTAGQTATYNLQVVPVNGFVGNVTYACSGAPSKSTCTVTPGSSNVNNANSAFTVSLATTATTTVGFVNNPPGPWNGTPVPLPVMLIVAGLTIAAIRLGMKPRLGAALGCVLLLAVMTACGGGGGGAANNGPTTVPGTPQGNYNLTISATSGGVVRNMNLTLTVN